MNERVLTKQQTQGRVQEQSQAAITAEMDKIVVGSIAAFTGLIGLWSAASLLSAMYQAGGPLQLIGCWFTAVSGL